jgi:uncharacterized membrane protein
MVELTNADLDQDQKLEASPRISIDIFCLWLISSLFFLWFQYITWTQYTAHRVFLIDAGLFDFMCSGFRHGHMMRFPLAWEAEANMLGDHFRPFFYLIGLLYLIYDHPMVMLSVFNAALVFAAIPLYYLAKDLLVNRAVAFQIVLLYLTNHFVRSIHLSIHAEALIPIGIFCLALAYQRKCNYLYWISIVYLFSQKEDIPLYMACMGLPFIIQGFVQKSYGWEFKKSLILFALSIILFPLALYCMYLFGSARLASSGINAFEKFSSMGFTKYEVLLYILQNPFEILSRVFRIPLLILFLSIGMFSLLDWKRFWVVIFCASIFMIVDNPLVSNLNYYYSYAALPFVFVTGVYGLNNLNKRFAGKPKYTYSVIAYFVVILLVQLPINTRTDSLPHLPFSKSPRYDLASEVIANIPAEADVAAQYDLYAREPNRKMKVPITVKHLYLVDYVLLDAKGRSVLDPSEIPEIKRILNSDSYELVMEIDGLQLLRRVSPVSSVAVNHPF